MIRRAWRSFNQVKHCRLRQDSAFGYQTLNTLCSTSTFGLQSEVVQSTDFSRLFCLTNFSEPTKVGTLNNFRLKTDLRTPYGFKLFVLLETARSPSQPVTLRSCIERCIVLCCGDAPWRKTPGVCP